MKYDIKTTKIGKDYTIQENLYNDLLGNVKEKLCKEISENYDKLAFSALEPYGITGDNWTDNVGRVVIASTSFSKHFFVDGLYAFSIVTFIDDSEFNAENHFKLTMKYRIDIYEHMLGMRTK